jgi:VanZ family protein
MKTLYGFLCLVPRWVYRVVGVSLYILMLILGGIEEVNDALPAGKDYGKVYHLLFYFSLGGLLWFSFRNASVFTVTVLIAVAACIDEFHQYFLPFRHAHVSDVLLDTIAGLLAVFVLYRLHTKAADIK